MSVNNGSSVYNEGGLTSADVKSIIDNTPNIKNVQADWNQTDLTADNFIKNKPYFTKYTSSYAVKFKVCTVPKFTAGSSSCGGIEVLYRIGDGAVYGELLHKVTYELYLKRIGDVSLNVNTLKFYYVENPNNSSYNDIYADGNPYCTLTAAPLTNIPKDRADFTDFGTVVPSIPEGAAEVSKVWVANSAASSGTAPIKVSAYGDLTPVTMDNYPTSGSTGLVNSGNLYNVFTDDNGGEIVEAPPQRVYVTGKFYFIVGKVCRCTAYSATSATFDVYGVVEALNYVLSQT